MKLLAPCIILVEPQLGENIGASCRAMLNFGVSDLRLVNPRDGWPNIKANAMAAGALEDKTFNVAVYKDIKEATYDVSYLLATTARIRDMNKPVFNSKEGIDKLIIAQNQGLKAGIIFGGEKSGLNNEDLVKADALINIENNQNFSSINLSMSVLLICYEWFFNTIKLDKTTDIPIKNEKVMANKSELNYFIDRLVSILDSTNFFTPDEKRKVMINNIEAIFTRNNLTLQELNTLHGIISSIIRS
ncbi:MAG: TrmH family RNA methyltransferase [Alphaproteobacteria bacterium]|nr:TrmH family RNA methyltransferase [Alphaproteobacteria bacterium]